MKPLIIAFVFLASAQVVLPSENFPRATPESVGISSRAVLDMVNAFDEDIDSVHSFMLLRNGRVVAEAWWTPYEPEAQHTLYSLTKSFVSTAIGIAQDEGLLNVEDTVISFFPNEAPKVASANMKQMRIRDLLTMTTGHVDDTMDRLRASENGEWTKAFLATNPEHRPGIHFRYNSGASYMLSAIVQKVTGQSVVDYLQPRLFEPLGIEKPLWGSSDEGVNLGGGGMKSRTEDIARFGQLYLQKGVWNGKRILSEAWVEAATSRQTSSGSGAAGNWNHGYGYQFWRNKPMGYRADGAFGQFSFVLPELDIVLAVTSGTSNTGGVMNAVWDNLLPGVGKVPLKRDRVSFGALQDKLSSLYLPTQDGVTASSMISKVSAKNYVFDENEQGIDSVELDFSGEVPVLKIADNTGDHVLPIGYGKWIVTKSDFRPRISTLYADPGQRIAMSGAWTSDSTFLMKIRFAETPYTSLLKLTFVGDELRLDMSHDKRWDGPLVRPQLIGIRR